MRIKNITALYWVLVANYYKMIYSNEIDFLKKVEDITNPHNDRVIFNSDMILGLKLAFPKISLDYINYLEEIGAGSFREAQFRVCGILFDLKEVEKDIYFFGDNYAGDFSGFDFNNDNGFVVEFWEDGTIYETKKRFAEYIRGEMLIDENNEDLREN